MKQQYINIFLVLCTAGLFIPPKASAQGDDFGIWTSVGAEKKFNKKWSMEAEGEHRTRNNSKTIDRWAFGLDGTYKATSWLKISAGYTLLYDNNVEKVSVHEDGTFNNWRPSYWGVRHRTNVSLSGSIDMGAFSFSLRERWQYTYRPEKTTQRYDFDNAQWEDKIVSGKGKNVLRSRLQIEYNIPKCKIDPYASVELFNAWALQKVRYTIGADWKIRKKHVVGMYYRFQNVNSDDDDNEPSTHVLGLNYKYKF
ncbi:MAG: DUF2490 domain-containing protein [Prevotella sp.]